MRTTGGSTLKRIYASLATGLGFTLLATPAFAGNVTLVNTAPSGTWHFLIECFTASGESAGASLGQLAAGKSMQEGNAACERFTVKFKTLNSKKDEDYTLVPGKRYKYFWNIDHWDLAPA